MNDLVEFLQARLDEDKAVARAATHGGEGHWWQDDPARFPGRIEHDGTEQAVAHLPVVYDEGMPSDEQAAHIARHDPSRILAEVEAKRRLMERHGPSDRREYSYFLCTGCSDGHPCDTLRVLALPYASHPDHLDEWRP